MKCIAVILYIIIIVLLLAYVIWSGMGNSQTVYVPLGLEGW